MAYNWKCENIEALVVGGSRTGEGDDGPGDCVLLDFENRFFAIADSSVRNPVFSRNLLLQVHGAIEGVRSGMDARKGIDSLYNRIDERLDEILASYYGKGSCTLTGILGLETGAENRALLLHTGDSSLTMYDATTGSARAVSVSNFWLAGKTKKLFQLEVIDLPDGCWLLLATDGFIDVVRSRYPALEEFLASRLADEGGGVTFREIVAMRDGGKLYDDAGMILFKPDAIKGCHGMIISGCADGDVENGVTMTCC